MCASDVLCEAAMCLDDLFTRNACFSLQAVNVLSKELEQEPLLV